MAKDDSKKDKPKSKKDAWDFVSRVRNERKREHGFDYRQAALSILPHVCARCGREFEGKNLSLLTVHHKDSNHLNNPRDGSNWELLCRYCHDDEHSRDILANRIDTEASQNGRESGEKSGGMLSMADKLKAALEKKK